MNAPVLNQEQEEAASAIFQFLLSDKKEFNVSGPAGTGKTFLMHYVMRHVIPEYEQASQLLGTKPIQFEIALTATTNKAAEVLYQSTGFPAQTIHSFMNLKVFDDYKTGVSKIRPTGAWKVHTQTLLFIDEASMIDSALHKMINTGTDNSCKIIYLGDHCQLAPVFEKISPVYADPTYGAHLKTPVRNASQPALVALCSQLRRNVETLDFQPIQAVPGVIDYLDDPQAKSVIDLGFLQEGGSARILSYTNDRVSQYNEYIRDLRGYPTHFTQGERVINNSAMEVGTAKTMLKVEEEFRIDEIDPAPSLLEFDDGNAQIDVYKARIGNPRVSAAVSIPAHPDHYKAVMRYYSSQKNWKVFYWLKNNFPDLRPKDAATVYKAQGSTYEIVFLDLANIGKCTDYDQVARMLYVGASRATDRLFLYGALPPRFHARAAAQAVA